MLYRNCNPYKAKSAIGFDWLVAETTSAVRLPSNRSRYSNNESQSEWTFKLLDEIGENITTA